MQRRQMSRPFGFVGFNWTTVFMTAGIAIVAPYLIRRLMPLLSGDVGDVSANDVTLAGKDAGRDLADDMNVGGMGGKFSRGVDRVTDRLSH